MSKERVSKWHEKIFTGVISATVGITLLFNGFTYLISAFITDNGIEGKPTKQKALVAFFSTLESGWWKYLIAFAFLLIAFLEMKSGIEKYQNHS